jgi:hypothetical protein
MRVIPASLFALLAAAIPVAIIGCGSSASNSVSTPADFTLTASPDTVSLMAGATGQSVAVTASALNGFTAHVNVNLSGLPAGVTSNPSTLILSPGMAQNVTLTAPTSAAAGNTMITLTGTSGSLSHTANVTVIVVGETHVPDFALAAVPTSLTLTAGGTGQTVAVTANALGDFTGRVSVALSGLPSGVSASPSTLTLTPDTAQYVKLTAAATAPTGSATVTFTGASGSLSHAATLQLTVNAPAATGVDVTTYHYDNARDGLNANETILTPSNVNSAGFGKVGFATTDGKVDAAPLYLSGMIINGQTRNVLYVASEHDSVYAFDADSGAQLWKTSVLGANESTSDDHGCSQITPEIGITSTPVIDRHYGAHGAIFVVGMSKDTSSSYHQRLHALDLATGAELIGSPTEIQATYPGTGSASESGSQIFHAEQYAERAGILLMNGTIYLGWTSHCDQQPYTGWLMAYSEQMLKQTAVLNLTPNTSASGNSFGQAEGSIWMAGAGLAGDASGNIYFLDANGGFDTSLDMNGFPLHGDYGNAFMKVSTANGKLVVADYFNSSNTVMESDADQDLGSGGVLLLPDQTDQDGRVHQLAVGAGKDSSIYVVDRNDMGKFNSVSNNIYQQLPGALANGEWGKPAWFNGTVYYGGQNDVLKAFSIVHARLQTTPASQSSTAFPYPGTTPSVSADGTQNGIVWAVENSANGVLHAYDAANLGHELYNSNQAANGRDNFADNKFITPVVIDGKVYVGTPTGVVIFGLLTH